jgi:hypothetical protein
VVNRLHTEGSGFSEESSDGSRKKTNQDNSMMGLKAEEADKTAEKEMRDSAGKNIKDGIRDVIQTLTQMHKIGNESLVLLQVNCRSTIFPGP